MASLRKPARASTRPCFRFNGRHYQRSLKTTDQANARAALGRIADTLHLLATGRLSIPPDVDPGDFIVTSGAEKAPRSAAKVPTLEQFLTEYRENHPEGTKSENTLRTEQIHINHFLRLNKGLSRRSIGQLNFGHFQQYIGRRLEGRRADDRRQGGGDLALRPRPRPEAGPPVGPPDRGPRAAQVRGLPPHRTMEEVKAIIARKGLTGDETDGLWDAIYLTTAEIAGATALVRDRARHPWIYPMFCLVAYTGIRSSMLLSRVDEVDLGRNLVFVRSRKFERGLTESRGWRCRCTRPQGGDGRLAGTSPRRPVHDHAGRPRAADQGRGPPSLQACAGGDEV